MNTRMSTPVFHAVRHARVWRQAFVQALGREAQFRAQAATVVVVGVLELGLLLVPVLVVYGHAATVRGWSAGEVVAVTGMLQVTLSLLAAFVEPNLTRMTAYVAEGELDGVLVRPVSAQAFTTLRWTAPAELVGVPTGLAVTVAGLVVARVVPGPLDVLVALAWLALGLVLVTCLWANLAYLAFWYRAAEPVAELVAALLDAGRYPLAFYPRAVRTAFTVVVPIGVATTLPVEALAGAGRPVLLLAGAGGVVLALALTRLHWRAALSRYASASS